jgi:protein gp37
MGENSKISWTDHTFNIAWGCTEVSPACDHCYAREFSKRMQYDGQQHTDKNGNLLPIKPVIWGHEAERRTFDAKHWQEPLSWNLKASKAGKPAYVFCSSMCDIFEDHPVIVREWMKVPPLTAQTPWLIWLLLTKRFEKIKHHPELEHMPNAMMGVTVENQTYDFRIVPGVTWISAEPLLGSLDLSAILTQNNHADYRLNWVIIGGESGIGAREMKPEWALDLIRQCKEAGVAVHFKQTGDVLARKLGLKDKS